MASRSKYHSKKVTHNGITYDSKKECQRHSELLLLERAGVIQGLERQVKFELIPSQRIDGKVVERPCSYVADFTYRDANGVLRVEDVKGYKGSTAYAVFALKRKLMLWVHGIRIREV